MADVWTAHFEPFARGNGCGCIRAGRNGWTFGDVPEFVASVDRLADNEVELKAAKGTASVGLRMAIAAVLHPHGITVCWMGWYDAQHQYHRRPYRWREGRT